MKVSQFHYRLYRFFFQAEDGIRDIGVTGVQTCALPIFGVATANSILLVTFAIERMELGRTALQAAVDAGCTRLRPICMTALAMIIGMLPMALGMGEGGEQNAPLARAVIGGLTVATFVALFFVTVMFSDLH